MNLIKRILEKWPPKGSISQRPSENFKFYLSIVKGINSLFDEAKKSLELKDSEDNDYIALAIFKSSVFKGIVERDPTKLPRYYTALMEGTFDANIREYESKRGELLGRTA